MTENRSIAPRPPLVPHEVMQNCRFDPDGCRDRVVQLKTMDKGGHHGQLHGHPSHTDGVKCQPARQHTASRLADLGTQRTGYVVV
jgi:hypothetical protein